MAFDARVLSGIGVLAAVVEAKSFARAATALGLTQSGVSRAVARLEERVGVRLLQRNARAVTLTDEGRRFYERVAPLLAGSRPPRTRPPWPRPGRAGSFVFRSIRSSRGPSSPRASRPSSP